MVSLVEVFTIFLYFYAVFTPVSFFLFESRIEKLENEVKELTLELIRLKRKINGKDDK
jgi:hypothetical protein